MNREEEELQFLGFFGTLKESFKIIYSWPTIFSKILLTLILPLSFIFLLHIDISDRLLSDVNPDSLYHDRSPRTPRYGKLSDIFSKDWTLFLLFKVAYFTLLLILSLLSTAAVVYTIASIYTSRDVTFRNVISVISRVWKRLMATFICAFFAYCLLLAFYITMFISSMTILGYDNIFSLSALVLIVGLFIIGYVYICVVWQLACVVSVLEDFYGVDAMMRSKDLIKGKTGLAVAVFFVFFCLKMNMMSEFQRLVVFGSSIGMVGQASYAILFFLLLSGIILYGLTVQTVIYFVCKSYHHEKIDKSGLSDRLEVYLQKYVPLKPNDVQLEHFEI